MRGKLLKIKLEKIELKFNLFFIFERFILVYKPMSIKQLDYKKTIISIAVCFMIGFFCASAPLFGWSYYSLEGSLTSCSIEWKSRSFNVVTYNMFCMVTVYFLPVTIITYTNIKLLLIVREFQKILGLYDRVKPHKIFGIFICSALGRVDLVKDENSI